jgi:TP53 regulating kinase-like protein
MSNMSISSSTTTSNTNNNTNTNNNAPLHQPPPTFTPQEDWTLISQGAEARIWKIPSFTATPTTTATATDNATSSSSMTSMTSMKMKTITAVAKERFTKAYRHAILDERLTKHRCRAEARILEKCLKRGGMDVPKVYQIQGPVLYLEFIEGVTVRDYLLSLHTACTDTDTDTNTNHTGDNSNNGDNKNQSSSSNNEKEQTQAQDMARHIGTTVGKLHSLGIVHGDLTTSNMMLRSEQKQAAKDDDDDDDDGDGVDNTGMTSSSTRTKTSIPAPKKKNNLTLIDFGLGKNTESAEERAVDLYVLERALLSTHPTLPTTFWSIVMAAYEQAATAASTTSTSATSSGNPKKGCQATLTRLELVRQRGRKRECFG